MTVAPGVAALALCYAGMSAICLSMDRHYRRVWQKPGSRERLRVLRAGGWLVVALSVVDCMRSWGTGTGLIVWFGLLSVASAVIVLTLSYAPRALARSAIVAAPIGLVLGLI